MSVSHAAFRASSLVFANLIASDFLEGRQAFAQSEDPLTNLPQIEQQELEPARKAPRNYPYLELELGIETGGDFVARSDDPVARINEIFGEAALAATLGVSELVAIQLGVTVERVLDGAPGKDLAFDHIGAYVDTLSLRFDPGNFTIYGGKFGPTFGKAWDITPGVYGTDLAEDYELAEQLGLAVLYTMATPAAGAYILGASLFTADTSFLFRSALTDRGRARFADGGAGNTGKPNNFSLTLEGEEIPGVEGFSFNLGYRRLAKGVGSVSAEQGIVAGLAQRFDYNGVTIGGMAEVAYFDHFGGSTVDALYLTAGLFAENGPWHGEISASRRNFNDIGAPDVNATLFQISGGYAFENGIDVSVGTAFFDDDHVDSATVGFRLTRAFTYSSDQPQ